MSTLVLPTAIERMAADLSESFGQSPGNAAGTVIVSIRSVAKGKTKVRGRARAEAREAMSALAEAKLAAGVHAVEVRRLEGVEAHAGLMTEEQRRHLAERAKSRLAVAEGLLTALSSDSTARLRAAESAYKLLNGKRPKGEPPVEEIREQVEKLVGADRRILEMFGPASGASFAAGVATQGRPAAPPPQAAAAPTAAPGAPPVDPAFEKQHPRGRAGQWIEKGEGMQGAPSPRVEQLQKRLSELGFRASPDGGFGPVTEEAVKAFQRTYGLEETGRVDAATVAALRNPPAPVQMMQPVAAVEPAAPAAAAPATAAPAAAPAAAAPDAVVGSAATSAAAPGDEFRLNPPVPAARTSSGALVDLRDPEAVKVFQREHGLEPTGDVNAETRAAITAVEHHQATASATTAAKEKTAAAKKAVEKTTAQTGDTMREGDGVKGKPDADVKSAQDSLAVLGFDLGDGGADGRFGPDTTKAVKSLQHKYGLEVDGIIGPATLRLLTRLKQREASQRKDKKAQASTDVIGAQVGEPEGAAVEEASYRSVSGTGVHPFGTAVPYGGMVPFLLDAVKALPDEKTKPPNLRSAGGAWSACHNCVWFHSPSECIYYSYPVEAGQVCDSYRTVTPEVGKMENSMSSTVAEALAYEAREALYEAEQRGDTTEILRQRARLVTLAETEEIEERAFSTAQRETLAKKGHALDDGSYPIETTGDLSNAIQAWGRCPQAKRGALKAHLLRQARRLGAGEDTMARIRALQA